jgi:Domain of unknown function (DUF4349)
MTHPAVYLAAALVAIGGCGEESSEKFQGPQAPAGVEDRPAVSRNEVKQLGLAKVDAPIAARSGGDRPGDEAVASTSGGQNSSPAPAAATRKIVYNAEIRLIVEDLAATEAGVNRLYKRFKGYLAEQEIIGAAGSQRTGRWKVRVPIDEFDQFIAGVSKLGVPERNVLTSEDVTDRFYDTKTRIQSKKVEEARLIKLLEERTGKLEDVIKVETELSRVRGEVERLQGALNVLADLSALTTVTIYAQERKDYVPPAAPTFRNKVRMTFFDSVDALVRTGKVIALLCVTLAPWVPVIALGAALGWLVRRRVTDRLRPAAQIAPSPFSPPRSPGDAQSR